MNSGFVCQQQPAAARLCGKPSLAVLTKAVNVAREAIVRMPCVFLRLLAKPATTLQAQITELPTKSIIG